MLIAANIMRRGTAGLADSQRLLAVLSTDRDDGNTIDQFLRRCGKVENRIISVNLLTVSEEAVTQSS